MTVAHDFWMNKRVLLTGHTGFKGSWMGMWLASMGASVVGYSLEPPTKPSLFEIAELNKLVESRIGDIRDYERLIQTVRETKPDIIIHMAAQPLVRESYRSPMDTYGVNVMGTVNLLEAVRQIGGVRAVVNVTTDKCYDNKEWLWGYREYEPLGGYDPYSSSKACSELVTGAYRDSFFKTTDTAVASARAGNVIGGGDWASDRLIPDCLHALLRNENIILRNPTSIRPWQHVLEPISGYLLLAQRLYEHGQTYAEAWNFGPEDRDAQTVEWIVRKLSALWGVDASYTITKEEQPHEAHYLKLDCSKSKMKLGWHQKWTLETALAAIVEWARSYDNGSNMLDVCLKQITSYSNTGAGDVHG